MVCGADGGREEGEERGSGGGKECRGFEKRKRRREREERRKAGGEGDVRTQQRQQSHQVMDTLTDKQHSGRDRQTSRGCNAERAQTIPDCACVSVYAQSEKLEKRMCVHACVRLH